MALKGIVYGGIKGGGKPAVVGGNAGMGGARPRKVNMPAGQGTPIGNGRPAPTTGGMGPRVPMKTAAAGVARMAKGGSVKGKAPKKKGK